MPNAESNVGLVAVQSYLIDLGLAPSVEEALSNMMEAGEKAAVHTPLYEAAHVLMHHGRWVRIVRLGDEDSKQER